MRAKPEAAPPKIKSVATPSLPIFTGIILGTAILGAGAIVFFFNPNTHGFYPVCQFHRLTGLNCPGCGGTRALYALLHGNFLLALRDNALFVLTFAALAVWSARFAFQKRRNPNATLNLPPGVLWTFLAVTIVFTILRNLPAFSFLSP